MDCIENESERYPNIHSIINFMNDINHLNYDVFVLVMICTWLNVLPTSYEMTKVKVAVLIIVFILIAIETTENKTVQVGYMNVTDD